MLRAQRPVDHQYITGKDTGTNHGLPIHSHKKGSGRVLYAQLT
jgi:hypothetical protein